MATFLRVPVSTYLGAISAPFRYVSTGLRGYVNKGIRGYVSTGSRGSVNTYLRKYVNKGLCYTSRRAIIDLSAGQPTSPGEPE